MPFCKTTIYNLAINLFYVRLSTVIGCHWSCVRGERFHGPFPDFPCDFPHCILSLWRPNQQSMSLSAVLKKKAPVIRWVEVASSPNLRHRGGHRFVSPPEEEDFDLTSAMRGAETSHSSIREPRSTNMDYPSSLGKHFVSYFSIQAAVPRRVFVNQCVSRLCFSSNILGQSYGEMVCLECINKSFRFQRTIRPNEEMNEVD